MINYELDVACQEISFWLSIDALFFARLTYRSSQVSGKFAKEELIWHELMETVKQREPPEH